MLVRRGAWVIGLLLAAMLGGCGAREETLPQFEQRWHQAVNQRQGQDLFKLLDATSQRRVQQELEMLRGLEAQAQQAVIDQLGGVRVRSLMELQPADYFALLWEQATEGKRPTMSVEASDQSTAYMVLSLEGRGRQRIRLIRQAGRWSWQLPAMAADQTAGWWSVPGPDSRQAPAQAAVPVSR